MTELEEGLQRVGLLNVIRDVLIRPNATADDVVAAAQHHLECQQAPHPIASAPSSNPEGCVSAILECQSEGIAVEVSRFLQGEIESTAAVALNVWQAFKKVSVILCGRLVCATGRGVSTTVYDALFRWVSTEHMKVALVGVVPGTLPIDNYDYEALQNDIRFPQMNAIGCRVLESLVTKYLRNCPVRSYTAEFLRPIASVCQLTDYTQGAVDWWVTQLLANVPEDDDEFEYCSTMLQERCKEYVEGLTLPWTETNKNYPARVLQHLVYYNEMLNSEQANKPSTLSRMSLG